MKEEKIKILLIVEKFINILMQNNNYNFLINANDKKYMGLLSIESLIFRNVGRL